MLDAATVADTVCEQENRDRGYDDDHRESPRGDSANSITPPEEHGQRCNKDSCDLHDVIRGRDARGRIENRRQNWEREGQEQREERNYDYYGPYYDRPHWDWSPEVGHILEGVRVYSQDLKLVRWPVNFKTSELRSTTSPPIYLSGLRCTSSPSKLPKGTRTSWQTTCQSVYHRLLGPGSSGSPWDHFGLGTTYVGCSPAISMPHVRGQESTGI
jgi:hypothetical protein